METKICTKCKADKPRDEFYSRGDGTVRVQAQCKACCALNAEKQREWRRNNPDRAKSHELKTRFGINLFEYQRMLEEQQGGCAVCGKRGGEVGSGSGQANYLAVDHSAKTGAIRGLLCTNCNLGIGSFKDNPELLRLAAAYLDENSSPREKAALAADKLLEEINGP